MQTFPVLQSSFARFLSRLLPKGLTFNRRYRLIIINAVFLSVATLIAIAAVSGQPFSFMSNGTVCGIPGGASETYSISSGGIVVRLPFFESLGRFGRSCGSCLH